MIYLSDEWHKRNWRNLKSNISVQFTAQVISKRLPRKAPYDLLNIYINRVLSKVS